MLTLRRSAIEQICTDDEGVEGCVILGNVVNLQVIKYIFSVNKFKYTDNAKRFQNSFRESLFFNSVEACLNSIPELYEADWSPHIYGNLSSGLKGVDTLLSSLKIKLLEQHEHLIGHYSEQELSRPINHDLEFVLKHTTFYVVTEEDEDYYDSNGIHHVATVVTVNDCFKDQNAQELQLCGQPAQRKIPVPSLEGHTRLGVYLSQTGTIMLWIDRISACEHPVLIFQKVLVHEIIHALMDISPRQILNNGNTNIVGDNSDHDDEEKYDNTLVLQAYQDDKRYFEIVKDFINNQPGAYSDSIYEYSQEKYWYTDHIKNHLTKKLDINAKPGNWYPRYSYGCEKEIQARLDNSLNILEVKKWDNNSYEIYVKVLPFPVYIEFPRSHSFRHFRLFFSHNGSEYIYDSTVDQLLVKRGAKITRSNYNPILQLISKMRVCLF